VDNEVFALAVYNSDLIAAGQFSSAGGVVANRIARWNGGAWQALGAGAASSVLALAACNSDLVAGGGFSVVGGQVSSRVARWSDMGVPWIAQQPAAQPFLCPGSEAHFTIAPANGYGPLTFRWRRNASPLTDGPTPSGSVISGSATPALTISSVSAADNGDYDAVVTSGCGSITSTAAALSACYANCDCSVQPPILNVNDFICFQSRFAAADPYADCNADAALNVNDFICFQTAFAAGCP
jgi:hypothetical protein